MKKSTIIFVATALSAVVYLNSISSSVVASNVKSSNYGILTDTTKKAKKAEVKEEAPAAPADSVKSEQK